MTIDLDMPTDDAVLKHFRLLYTGISHPCRKQLRHLLDELRKLEDPKGQMEELQRQAASLDKHDDEQTPGMRVYELKQARELCSRLAAHLQRVPRRPPDDPSPQEPPSVQSLRRQISGLDHELQEVISSSLEAYGQDQP